MVARLALASSLLLAGLGLACAAARGGGAHGIEVNDESGNAVWRGPASFTVRAARGGAVERAVGLPGLGELQVGVAEDAGACRLVWSKNGLADLVVYSAAVSPCAEVQRGRLCLAEVVFKRSSIHASAPPALRVSGCADENDLLWGRIDGEPPATVGPRALRLRCVRLRPPTKTCPLVYLKKERIAVPSNPAAEEGFTFAFDVDGWRACFLEAEEGPYELRVFVEDSCGKSTSLRLDGDSAELDD